MDLALRILALMAEVSYAKIARDAIHAGLKKNPVYVALTAFAKQLSDDEYAAIKKQMQNTALPPADRIPEPIKKILSEVINE